MIYWYSGTGNSRFVAQSLGSLLSESDLRFIPNALGLSRERAIGPSEPTAASGGASASSAASHGRKSVGFVFPIYSWGVPPIVLEWIAKIPAEELDGAYIYAVMTCGDEAGDALRMLLKAFRKRSVKLNASFTVVMPNNYVLLPGFSTDPLELEDDKLSRSLERIREIADTVKSGAEVCDVLRGKWPRLKTALVYPLFRRWGVQPSRWRVDAAKCISCGKCAAVCPVENIRLGVASASDEISENVSVVEERQEKAGKACPEKRAEGKRLPGWGRKCISCTACYHCCPVGAVSYGSFTGTKRRYTPKFPRLPLPEKIDANK